MRFDRIRYLFLAVLVSTAAGRGMAGDMTGVKDLLNRSDREAKGIFISNVTSEKNEEAAQKAADEVMQTYNSPEYQKRLRDEIARLKAQLPPEAGEGDQPQLSRKIEGQNTFLLADERIYVFISSSVPMSTLKTYAADIDKLKDPHITMVTRGFIDGMRRVGPTIRFIRKILKKDPQCDDLAQCSVFDVPVNIDPLLFARYGIDSVPAILYVNGVDSVDPDTSEGIAENTSLS